MRRVRVGGFNVAPPQCAVCGLTDATRARACAGAHSGVRDQSDESDESDEGDKQDV